MHPRGRPARIQSLPDTAGSALLLCLTAMFIIMSVGASTLSVLLAKQASVKRAVEVDQAFLIAEAGVDVALFELRTSTDYGEDGIGEAVGTVGRGSFTATLIPEFAGPGEYTLRSEGTVSSITRAIEVVVGPMVRDIGFFGRSSIRMSGGMIDTYDSDLGTYASQVGAGGFAGSNATVHSNGNIDLSASAEIYGDATPGPTGMVTGDASGVTGSTAPASELVELEPYVYAPPIASSGPFAGTRVFRTGVYRYSSFTVLGGRTVTFDGNVELYVDGPFSVTGRGVGILRPGATVTIHHGSRDFTITGNGVVNRDQQPGNLNIFSATNSNVVIAGIPAFFGTVYAPEADFLARGTSGLYGAIQADTLTLGGGMSLHYDRSLGQATGELEVRLIHPTTP